MALLAEIALCLALQGANAPQNQSSTGRLLTPVGQSVATGGFPVQMEPSPDGRFVVVTHLGTEHNLTVLDAARGTVVDRRNFDGPGPDGQTKDGLYYGLRFGRDELGRTLLYVCHGAADRVDAYRFGYNGRLSGPVTSYRSPRPLLGSLMPHFLTSVALDSGQERLYAVGNQSFALSDFQGTLSIFRRGESKPERVVPLPAYPLDSRMLTKGPHRDRKLYVSCERDGIVAVVDPDSGKVLRTVRVGDSPSQLLLDAAQKRLFVSCAGSDQVSVIDTATDAVIETYLVRPIQQRGQPGANPLGMALSPDEKTLYVALADLNAVAVVRLADGRLSGMIPTGWYPTAVWADARSLMVTCGKGIAPVQPNLPAAGLSRDQQISGDSGPRIRANLRGTVTRITVPDSATLLRYSRLVVANNRLAVIDRPLPKPPGVEHVIYIVKENRTYDQLFGALPQGNGRPDLVLYGRDVTPNQHALAERFVLMDNFYCCAEMSADGWSWSTAGITSTYVQRNAQYEYSGRKREYDFEGQNNGTPVDARGERNVNDPPGGYIWDNALRHGKEFRNYGMYIAQGVPIRDRQGRPIAEDNTPTMRAFDGRYDPGFRMYDLNYADGDAWERHGLTFPKHRRSWGPRNAKSRVEAFRHDYERLLREGRVPPLMLVRLGNDHTAGTTPGSPTPAAMIADNDYATGQIVELVSKGPLWKKTAVVVVEDDAQGGYDHVDGHRSIAFVASPWVRKASVDHRFYNTDSALRTVEWLLGLKPSNQFTATARPFACFDRAPANDAPFEAILPDKGLFRANTEQSYRAADSRRLYHTYREESAADRELADILWGDRFGAKAPRPRVIGQRVVSPPPSKR